MTLPLQRQAFLDGEGDAWLRRNRQGKNNMYNEDDNTQQVNDLLFGLPLPNGPTIFACEVGCGQGERLHKLKNDLGWSVSGIDPSADAIAEVNARGCNGKVGTADSLPFQDNSVDLLIYGFCLYLCDREDLFKIAAEADRVLKPESWILIVDFWSKDACAVPYHHREGIYSYKDNLPGMFCWHPYYTMTDHRMRHHSTGKYTDVKKEWVSSTIIRRCQAK